MTIKPPNEWTDEERAWWDDWWAADYSWDGLAKKEWRGWRRDPNHPRVENDTTPRNVKPAHEAPEGWPTATLQDYWCNHTFLIGALTRITPPEALTRITPPEGWRETHGYEKSHEVKFTEFHLPFFDGQANRTEKVSWDAFKLGQFAQTLKKILRDAKETPVSASATDADPDYRAQWQGIVAPKVPSSGLPMQLMAQQSYLVVGAEWMGKHFAPFTDFNGAFFATATNLLGARLGNWTKFSGAIFSDELFLDDIVCLGNVDFSGCKFKQQLSCKRSVFLGQTDFSDAHLAKGGDFSRSIFASNLSFVRATFDWVLDFDDCVLLGLVVIFECGATGETPTTDLYNQSPGLLAFNNAWIERDLLVQGVKGLSAFQAKQATFVSRLSLHDTDFTQAFDVTGANFFVLEPASAGFPAQELLENYLEAEGDGSHSSDASFEGWKEKRLSARESEYRSRTNMAPAVLQLQASIWPISRFTPWRWLKVPLRRLRTLRPAEPKEVETASNYWASVEQDFQTLKVGMAGLGQNPLEQKFSRLEKLARRRRQDDSDVPGWEKAISCLFGVLSDFGGSAIRPLLILFGLILPLFASVYLAVGCQDTEEVCDGMRAIGPRFHPATWEALSFSGETVFRPFNVWVPPKDGDATVRQVLLSTADGNEGRRFGTQMLASLQSFISLVLIFLFALALRRRFQIS